MSLTKIINAALKSFKQNFKTICQNSNDMLDTLDNDSFKLMTSALLDAARCVGKDGLPLSLIETTSVIPVMF